jgi:serine/threonine protein kinase
MIHTVAGPEQTGAEDPVLADLVEELTARLQAGEPADLEALAGRHPEYAGRLRALLPALQALAGASAPASSASRDKKLLASPVDPLAGRLGDYRILREVGRGGMGVVYEAQQVSLARRVALKVLPFAAALDPTQLQRFRNEAQAAACLHHAHIVPVYAVGCEQGVHYYAMQFIDGRTVASLIAELRPLFRQAAEAGPTTRYPAPAKRAEAPNRHLAEAVTPPVAALTTEPSIRSTAYVRAAARLGVQAAEALEHAHRQGVIHRDIKPANLLLDARGDVWVTDFGLARLGSDGGLTRTGDVLGTLRYMSPEQALAKHGLVDHRTDVYALGATLFELLTLRPVFDGADRQQILARIAWEEPPSLRRLNPVVPVELDTVLQKALAKSVDERYATAQELADDLKRFLEDRPVRARRPTIPERARKWVRRHRTVVWAAVAVFLLAVGGLAAHAVLLSRQLDRTRAAEQEARQAVDTMYTEVAEHWISQQPQLEPLQREFLLKALQFYERFAEQHGTGAVRLEQARARRRVGDIRHRLGEDDAARTAYEGARALLQDPAGDLDALEERAIASIHLGNLCKDASQLTPAMQLYREAADDFATLANARPERPAYIDNRAGAANNLGLVLHALGRVREAEQAHRQAIDLLTPLAATSPAYRLDLAGAWNNLGSVLRDVARWPDAEQTHRRALTLATELAAAYPLPAYRRVLASCQENLGLLLGGTGRAADAEKLEREALAVRQRLAADYPHVPAYRQELATSHAHLGSLLMEARRVSEAEEAYRQSLTLRSLLLAEPGARPCRRDLADTLHRLGTLLMGTGRLAEAESAYRRALALRMELTNESSELPADRRALAESYQALGRLLAASGRAADAQRLYERAGDLCRQLAKDFPDVPGHKNAAEAVAAEQAALSRPAALE